MKYRMEGLLGARAMTLQPIPNSQPAYQIDGVYFAMWCPDGQSIRCVARRGIFDDQGHATPAEVLRFFEACLQTFHLAASVKYDMREFDERQGIVIGPSDVIPFANVL